MDSIRRSLDNGVMNIREGVGNTIKNVGDSHKSIKR